MRRCIASALTAACAVIATPGLAGAEASLRTGDGSGAIKEATHSSDVRVDGVIATVITTQALINTSDDPRMAVYTFQVPARAAVRSVSIRSGRGAAAVAHPVDAKAAIAIAPKTPGATPDVGLLRLVQRETAPRPLARDLLATYELRVYPVRKAQPTTIKIEWVAAMRYADGRLTLRIPARGATANLVRSRVVLSLRPPKGTLRLGAVYGGGKRLSAKHGTRGRRYRFAAAADEDVAIEATPVFRSTKPLLTFATAAMGPGFGAVAVAALTPQPKHKRSTSYERVFVLVDVSRSMGRQGLVAAAEMTKAVLAAAPAGARVEVIAFDRKTKRVLGELLPNLEDTRKIVARALRTMALRNGSDLGAALDVVRGIVARDQLPKIPPAGVVRGDGASTLVAIVTDGLTPVELTGKRAADRIGAKALRTGEVMAITLVPDRAATPLLDEGPLAALAKRTGGRSIAVRYSEVGTRGKNLASELNGPTELTGLSVHAPTGTVLQRLGLPKTIVAGGGAIRLGWYTGAAPKKITVRATRDRRPVTMQAQRSGPALRKATGNLALALPDGIDMLSELVVSDKDLSGVAARDRMLRAAARHKTVTTLQAFVALGADALSKQRRAFAKRWGTRLHRRHAPPAEQRDGGNFAAYAERQVASAAPVRHHVQGRTGSLDRAIVRRLVRTYVIPKVRACYESALRRNATLAGSLTIVMEMARGEVQFAEMGRSTLADNDMLACMTDAAYQTRVPRVALGATRDQVTVVRYPVRLRVAASRASVVEGTPAKRKPLKLDGPLDGLPSR